MGGRGTSDNGRTDGQTEQDQTGSWLGKHYERGSPIGRLAAYSALFIKMYVRHESRKPCMVASYASTHAAATYGGLEWNEGGRQLTESPARSLHERTRAGDY